MYLAAFKDFFGAVTNDYFRYCLIETDWSFSL